MPVGLPESWPMVGFTEEWYESMPIRWGDGYMVARARTPWVRWQFDRGPLGDHARWAIKMSMKYRPRQPWRFWSMKDLEPVIDVRFVELGSFERALAWVLTAVVLYGAVRR